MASRCSLVSRTRTHLEKKVLSDTHLAGRQPAVSRPPRHGVPRYLPHRFLLQLRNPDGPFFLVFRRRQTGALEWEGIEKERAYRPRLPLFMCRTSGGDGSSVGSRSSSDSSDHSEVLPLETIPSFDKSSTAYPAWPSPRASRGALVALVCSVCAAFSLSLCGGCFGGGCWTNAGGGEKPSDGSKLLKMSDGAYEEVSTQFLPLRIARRVNGKCWWF